ncbi:hypothetical protein H2200_013498 [Cladophialophora chaetospira]|uniref:Uncharacterized protein n=1 Tax=Cladophialophora chaetospira TaxID=386627 RepID=A0AA38TXE3_9EURO|nr:hypothetical protein H2200_013498 [Cladophialophora chaetospira]
MINITEAASRIAGVGREHILNAGAAGVSIAKDALTKQVTKQAPRVAEYVKEQIVNAGVVGHEIFERHAPQATEKIANAVASSEQVLHAGIAALGEAKQNEILHAPEAAGNAGDWVFQNPKLATGAGVIAFGVTLVVCPGCATAPLLSTAGFGAGGVQAGSAAAAVHAGIGNIVAGSAFAIGQSAGAGGAGLAIVNGVAQAGGGVLIAAGGGMALGKSKDEEEDNDPAIDTKSRFDESKTE